MSIAIALTLQLPSFGRALLTIRDRSQLFPLSAQHPLWLVLQQVDRQVKRNPDMREHNAGFYKIGREQPRCLKPL